MFGLLMLVLWFVSACVYGFRTSKRNSLSKKIAMENGHDSYVDSNNYSRDIDDDAMYYLHTDSNGDTWKIYPHHEKPNINATRDLKNKIRSRHAREEEEYRNKTLNIAESEGWRFYRVKEHNQALKCMTQNQYDTSNYYKGYETSGPDIYVDRDNGHECIFIKRFDAYFIYDLIDEKLYHWYFKTCGSDNERHIPMQDRQWDILDENSFYLLLSSSKEDPKDIFIKQNWKWYSSYDVNYKYGEQAEYKFSDAEIEKHYAERRYI